MGIAAWLDEIVERGGARGYLLDVWEVVLRPGAGPVERFERAAAEQGLKFAPERVARALAVADRWWEQPARKVPSTPRREAEDWVCYYGLVLQELGIDPEEAAVETVAARARLDRWLEPVAEGVAALTAVGQRRRVGIVSNALPSTRAVLERLGLAPLLHCCLLGTEQSWRLPERAGYAAGAAALGLPVGEVTFVTAAAELAAGANRAGLTAHLLTLGGDLSGMSDMACSTTPA